MFVFSPNIQADFLLKRSKCIFKVEIGGHWHLKLPYSLTEPTQHNSWPHKTNESSPSWLLFSLWSAFVCHEFITNSVQRNKIFGTVYGLWMYVWQFKLNITARNLLQDIIHKSSANVPFPETTQLGPFASIYAGNMNVWCKRLCCFRFRGLHLSATTVKQPSCEPQIRKVMKVSRPVYKRPDSRAVYCYFIVCWIKVQKKENKSSRGF